MILLVYGLVIATGWVGDYITILSRFRGKGESSDPYMMMRVIESLPSE